MDFIDLLLDAVLSKTQCRIDNVIHKITPTFLQAKGTVELMNIGFAIQKDMP